MRSGLEVLLADPSALRGQRVGLCCNHTAVTRTLDHALPALTAAGVPIQRLFGPEHGIDATAQDMIPVEDEAAVRVDRLVDVLARAQRGDHQRHLRRRRGLAPLSPRARAGGREGRRGRRPAGRRSPRA